MSDGYRDLIRAHDPLMLSNPMTLPHPSTTAAAGHICSSTPFANALP